MMMVLVVAMRTIRMMVMMMVMFHDDGYDDG